MLEFVFPLAMLMHFRRWKKIHLERRVNIYVDASDEKGKFLCWSSWVGWWIFPFEAVGKKAEFGEVGQFLCWCILGVNFAVNRGQSGQINERCKWIASGPFYLLRQQNTKCDDAPENEREENRHWPYKQNEGHKQSRGPSVAWKWFDCWTPNTSCMIFKIS